MILLRNTEYKERRDFQSAIFSESPTNTIDELATALQKVDLSKFIGKPTEINGYTVIVQKTQHLR